MARILPWTIDHAPPPKKARATPAPHLKQEKLSLHRDGDNSGDESATSGRGRTFKPSPNAKSSRRTLSSSPVRGPPPAQLMREGYDADDIFIMVEDEFQSIAQTYTAHLHHAEYKRLVKQAREASPKALPEPTSPMSKQAKNQIRAVVLEKRQKESLQRTGVTLNDEEDDDDEKVAANLWSGTSLGALMVSSSQQKRSLVGLEGMSSSTKAGLGMNRRNEARREVDEDEADDLDVDVVRPKAFLEPPKPASASVSQAERNNFSPKETDAELVSPPRPVKKIVPARSQSSIKTKPTERPVTKRKFLFDLDDGFDESKSVRSAGDAARNSRPWKEQEKKSRLDEVPMFII